jgi:hypothetical protein
VESWLTRARVRLRNGLTQRGVDPACGFLAALCPQEGWLPEVAAAVRNVLAANRGMVGAVSVTAATLAREVVRDLGVVGTKGVVTILLLMVGTATGLVASIPSRRHDRKPSGRSEK